MIRAQAPVVAAGAPRRAPAAPPPLPSLTPRAAAPVRPIPAGPPGSRTVPGAPAPRPAATPPPPDDLLPTPTTPPLPPAPAPNTMAAADELLPIAPPQPTQPRVAPSATRAWKPDKKLAMIGAGVLAFLVLAGFVWSKMRDDVQTAIHTPADAVGDATSAAAGVELQTAMQAANVLYLDVGSYTNVNPGTLKSVEPSITYVAGDAPAAAGQVSVLVKDAQSIVLVTAKPDGTCRALYQSQAGMQELVPPAPCAAANVQLGGGGIPAPQDVAGAGQSQVPSLPDPNAP